VAAWTGSVRHVSLAWTLRRLGGRAKHDASHIDCA
jgi:hypothetical protein